MADAIGRVGPTDYVEPSVAGVVDKAIANLGKLSPAPLASKGRSRSASRSAVVVVDPVAAPAGTFTDATEQYGLGHAGYSTQAAFFDCGGIRLMLGRAETAPGLGSGSFAERARGFPRGWAACKLRPDGR